MFLGFIWIIFYLEFPKVQLIGFYNGTVGLAEKELRISLTAIRELVVQIQLSFIAVSKCIA
jgi:recombinational DNA repair protein RecT